MTDQLLCTVEDGIATVTLNRPEKRNALNDALLTGIPATIDRLDADPSVRVVLIRGAGMSFCSGLDLRERSPAQNRGAQDTSFLDMVRRVESCRHPVIAAVQGAAIAGGCELALHCDLRVAADNVQFAMPLARLGIVLPIQLTQKLVEIIGPANTRRLLFTAQPVGAERALAIGMVHEVVPLAELEEASLALARTIAANAPLSLVGIKATIQRTIALRDTIPSDDLTELVLRARGSADASEGVRATLERRQPVFRGE